MTSILVHAPPERVFAVLADAGRYAGWVVGADDVRDADDEWPAPGAELHHSQGVRPLVLKDETRVVESEPPRRLVLHAEIEPLGTLLIELALEDEAGDTRLTMTETPHSGAVRLARNPLGDRLLAWRNGAALRRLKAIAEAG